MLLAIFTSSVLILLSEILLDYFLIKYKPSYFINLLANLLEKIWYYFGYYFGFISGLLSAIYSKIVQHAWANLVDSLLSIILSPFQFLKGYFNITVSYQYPVLVIFGSCLIIATGLSFYFRNQFYWAGYIFSWIKY